MFRENLAHASRREIAESSRWVQSIDCPAFAGRYASQGVGFLFGASHSRSGASAAWWEIRWGAVHRISVTSVRSPADGLSFSSGAEETCSVFAACETSNDIESIGSASTAYYQPRVRIKRAARIERDRPVSVRRGPPNHALEATAYRTALRLLVRLGLFCLPARLTSQGCASALIR